MKVGQIKPIVETTKLSRRKANQEIPKYQSNIDPAVIIHSNRTHKSVSEAFKDADYATPIWRCESEWDRTKPILTCILAFVFGAGIVYLFAQGFILWLAN